MTYEPKDGTWEVHPRAKRLLALRKSFGVEWYNRQKRDLKEFLCGYFSSVTACNSAQGRAVCPLKSTKAGGKVLKVRWLVPGSGKSGGLRLIVVAYCDRMRVVIAEAIDRKDGLTDAQVADAIKDLP